MGETENTVGEAEAELLSRLLTAFPKGRAAGLDEARAMLKKFGGFAALLDAPESTLKEAGAGDAARLLTLLPEAARAYFSGKSRELKRVCSTEAACKLLQPRFVGRKTEALALLILNARGHVVYDGIIAEGTLTGVPVYMRKMVMLCITHNADTVIVAHNHPSGSIMPSKADFIMTEEIAMTLSGIDVEVYDHIIFSENDYISMREGEVFKRINESIVAWRKRAFSDTLEK